MRKRGIVWQTLIPWLIALIVLVTFVAIDLLLKDRGTGIVEFIIRRVRYWR